MTVIFSKRKDTEFLSNIWKDIPNVNLIEISEFKFDKELVNNAISKETDMIIMCGHGTNNGLLTPDFEDMIISKLNVNLLQNKKVICIWCYANEFMEKYDLHGFGTSMFISDVNEYYDTNYWNGKDNDVLNSKIQEQNKLFAERINKLIKKNINIDLWVNMLRNEADMSIDFVEFNYLCLTSR